MERREIYYVLRINPIIIDSWTKKFYNMGMISSQELIDFAPLVHMLGIMPNKISDLNRCIQFADPDFVSIGEGRDDENVSLIAPGIQPSWRVKNRINFMRRDGRGSIYRITQSWFFPDGLHLLRMKGYEYIVGPLGELEFIQSKDLVPFVDRSEEKLLERVMRVGGEHHAIDFVGVEDIQKKALVPLNLFLSYFDDRGINTLVLIKDGCEILYIFDSIALGDILEKNKKLLEEEGWPC